MTCDRVNSGSWERIAAAAAARETAPRGPPISP